MTNGILNKCMTKQVIIPSGVILMFGILFPMISANSDEIQENTIEIVKLQTNLSNLDETITKLDNSAENIEEAIVKMKLVLCDVSEGKHC